MESFRRIAGWSTWLTVVALLAASCTSDGDDGGSPLSTVSTTAVPTSSTAAPAGDVVVSVLPSSPRRDGGALVFQTMVICSRRPVQPGDRWTYVACDAQGVVELRESSGDVRRIEGTSVNGVLFEFRAAGPCACDYRFLFTTSHGADTVYPPVEWLRAERLAPDETVSGLASPGRIFSAPASSKVVPYGDDEASLGAEFRVGAAPKAPSAIALTAEGRVLVVDWMKERVVAVSFDDARVDRVATLPGREPRTR